VVHPFTPKDSAVVFIAHHPQTANIGRAALINNSRSRRMCAGF